MTKREQMFALIAEQRASKQTAKDFCAGQGIKLSHFFYWVRKEKQSRQPLFLPVKTQAADSTPTPVELVYPSGTRLRLQQFGFHF